MPSEAPRAVKIRLEIDVPQGGVEPVIVYRPKPGEFQRHTITNPNSQTPTVNARCTAGNCVICTQGFGAPPGLPVFGQVFVKSALPQSPVPTQGGPWVYPNSNGRWGLSPDFFELPVPQPPDENTVYTLVIWTISSSGTFESQLADFKIKMSNATDCQGSGSGSSGSGHFFVKRRCHFCHADQPVPVALSLQLDKPVSPGTAGDCAKLNQPTRLLHSGDHGFECCWFSQPIDFCSDAANPAVWMLQKSDAKTWHLHLRRGHHEIVEYRLTTANEKDCSFPIKLQRAGAGDGECKNWPKTVTISAAP